MKCPQCDARTYVNSSVRNSPDSVKRYRRCYNCGMTATTIEVWHTRNKEKTTVIKPLYTKEEAALQKKKLVDARRKNEDRRIEDAS